MPYMIGCTSLNFPAAIFTATNMMQPAENWS